MYEAHYNKSPTQGEGASPGSGNRRAPWEEYSSRLDALGVTDFLQEQQTHTAQRQQGHTRRGGATDENRQPHVNTRALHATSQPPVKSILKKTSEKKTNHASQYTHPASPSSVSVSDHSRVASTPFMTPVHAQQQTLPSMYSPHISISQRSPPFSSEGAPAPSATAESPSGPTSRKSVFEEAANLQLSRAVERMRQASQQPNVSKDEVSALLQEVEDVLEHNMMTMQTAPEEDRWAPSPAHPFCYDADADDGPENAPESARERPSPVVSHREGLFRSLDGEFNPSSSSASVQGKREGVMPSSSPSHSPSPAKQAASAPSAEMEGATANIQQEQQHHQKQQQQQQQQMQWYYTYCAWMQYYQQMYAHAYQQHGTYPFHSYPPRANPTASAPPAPSYPLAAAPLRGTPDTSGMRLTLQELQEQQSVLSERISHIQSQLAGQDDAPRTRREEGDAEVRPRKRRASVPRKASRTANAASSSSTASLPRKPSSSKGRSTGSSSVSGGNKKRSSSSDNSYPVNPAPAQSSMSRSEEIRGERLSVYERKRRELASQRPSWKF